MTPPPDDRWLLISDLDETLLGDDAALARFRAYRDELGGRLEVVYASGRRFDSIVRCIRETELPDPVAAIGAVGSEVLSYPDGEPYAGWPSDEGWSAERVREVLASEPDVSLQSESEQTPHKVSYHLHGASGQRLEELLERLRAAGIDARRIYSSGRDLDFLPEGVDKGSAAEFVATRLGYARDRVVVAGNSGNDAALFAPGFLGVIVANAHDELKALAGPRSYLARSPFADGVVEGLRHWRSQAP